MANFEQILSSLKLGRITILVSGARGEKFLGVPKIIRGSAKEQELMFAFNAG